MPFIWSIKIPFQNQEKSKGKFLGYLDNHIQSLYHKEELKNLEELKKSILQKAFSGELTNKSVAV